MSYYHGLISSRKANSLLTKASDGCFLIRDSQSQPGCFVLSAKSSSRVYHVLIFNREGRYTLDATEEGDEPLTDFSSLDDLVVFCMGHELKVAGDDVQLHEVVPCAGESDQPQRSPGRVRRFQPLSREDSDALTDLLATLFGAHCSVIAVAHSKLNFDGQSLSEGVEYLSVLVKDSQQKGYFIRIVNPKEKTVLGGKRVGKNFQYDTPGDLVITYLSEHGITCVGFHDAQEKDYFTRHLDRIVKLQQDKAVKLRARVDSEAKHMKGPTDLTHRVKAADFDIDHLTPEWRYLFDLAGVTRAMLEDKATLQFILDTVHQIGGAPKKLEQVQQEAVSNEGGDPPTHHCDPSRRKERLTALAVDHALRRESLRASRLANELKKNSLRKDSPQPTVPTCPVLAHCELFKDHLMIKHSLFAIGPNKSTCFCERCMAGKPVVGVSGSPPQQYTVPVGWSQFVLRSQAHALAQQFCAKWHVAYCSVPSSRVAGIMRTGQLLHSQTSGDVLLSPDIQCACRIASITPESYQDEVTGKSYRVNTAFKVYIQPGSYTVEHAEGDQTGDSLLQSQHQWHAPERTYIVHALLVQMLPRD